MLYNPDCETFIENVVFKDLTDDWNMVCQALGQPLNRLHSPYWEVLVRER